MLVWTNTYVGGLSPSVIGIFIFYFLVNILYRLIFKLRFKPQNVEVD